MSTDEYGIGQCSRCSAVVYWAKHVDTGVLAPIDAQASLGGPIQLLRLTGRGICYRYFEDSGELLGYTSHMATCAALREERSLDERFASFHAENPHVYEELRMLALRARRSGAERVGIKMLFEVLRWRYMLRTRGDEYRLNNAFTSRYARLLMEQDPELEGIFETRKLKAAA